MSKLPSSYKEQSSCHQCVFCEFYSSVNQLMRHCALNGGMDHGNLTAKECMEWLNDHRVHGMGICDHFKSIREGEIDND